MLQSLKQKTLVGKLWAIIVLAVAAIFIGVVFGPGIAKMIAGPTHFAPLDDHDVLSLQGQYLEADIDTLIDYYAETGRSVSGKRDEVSAREYIMPINTPDATVYIGVEVPAPKSATPRRSLPIPSGLSMTRTAVMSGTAPTCRCAARCSPWMMRPGSCGKITSLTPVLAMMISVCLTTAQPFRWC